MFKSPRHVFLLMALAVVLASAPAGIGITAQQSNSVQWFEIGLDLNMERGFGVWRSFPISERSADSRFRLLPPSQLYFFPNLADSLLPGCLVGQCGDRPSGAVSEYDGGPMLNQTRQFGLGAAAPPAPEQNELGAAETDDGDQIEGDQEETDSFQVEETERPPIPAVEDEEPLPIAAFPLAPPEEEEESFISSLPWWAWAVGGAIALVVLSSAGGGGGGGGGDKSSGDGGSGGQGGESGSVGYKWN